MGAFVRKQRGGQITLLCQFSHLPTGEHSTYSTGLFGGLNELIHVQAQQQLALAAVPYQRKGMTLSFSDVSPQMRHFLSLSSSCVIYKMGILISVI